MSTSPPSVNGRTRDDSGRMVQKLWSYCHVLRDDGLSYQDYLEQLTQLLFLKLSDERTALTGQEQAVPRGFRWADLARPDMEGTRLERSLREDRPRSLIQMATGLRKPFENLVR